MKQWFIIKSKPQREDTVEILLSKASIEVFNPKIRELTYRNRTSYVRTTPLFPTYLFLNIDFEQANNIHMIKYTRGVSKILCAGDCPIPVDQEIIETIRLRSNESGVIEPQSRFKSGDTIRVKKGLLKDLIGVLGKPVPHEERVLVLLKLVNYDMKVHLHWSEIEKIKAA